MQTCSLWVILFSWATLTVGALPPVCDLLQALWRDRDQCLHELRKEWKNNSENEPPISGCPRLWDNTICWPFSSVGQTVKVECPKFFQMLTGKNGSVFRNCTQDGWSEPFVRIDTACGYDVNDSTDDKKHFYLLKLKVVYTVGYSISLVMLLIALGILVAFRKLHCTRNYIHMHLFVSFILRALSNFIKDAELFSNDVARCYHTVGCKTIMVFFQYCILSNYSWLLVEGLYLHTLLVISFFSEKKVLQYFIIFGWGFPAVFVIPWAITRHFMENNGCWDINANPSIWWIIRGPVIVSILVNFILFVNILRILMKKLKTPEMRGNDMSHYKRLAKSTLLLIPLFGIHYIVFAFTFCLEDTSSPTMEIQVFFELALGSFQGLVVAVLYCFLNGEVQLEIQRKWRQRHLNNWFWMRPSMSSSFSNGTSGLTQMTKTSPSEQGRGTAWKASVI
ncbi:secretin receptor [Dromiciops gliroides]|uniref:secretin receptor n=1 Tax=Dromiciops gliroides TaxID=33562 RepID=UPI001CC71D46|nr:secretin receptor [Dromiciops gliroides]